MAGYNNYYPQTYANTMYGYGVNIAPAQTTTVPNNIQGQLGAINWVQGEAGARSVPVAAGQKVLLMDSENNVFYVKSSDATGMPLPLRIFEYKEVGAETNSTSAQPQSEYVTHEELKRALEELKQASKPLSKPKEEKSNEFII